MGKSPQIQSRISAIAKDLANGKKRAEIMPKYAKKWGISETSVDRYITNAKKEAQERRNLAAKAADDTLIAETKEAIKQGIKTKTERLLILQEQIDNCLQDLNDKKLSVYDKVALRKAIKELQSEISKMEGDYAAQKQQHEVGDSFLDFLKHTSAE